jgi:hypothetical protein
LGVPQETKMISRTRLALGGTVAAVACLAALCGVAGHQGSFFNAKSEGPTSASGKFQWCRQWEGKQQDKEPIILTIGTPSVRWYQLGAGPMDCGETVRILWRLVNPTPSPVTLQAITADCACTEAAPAAGVLAPDSAIDGFLDYKQGTLGHTRRNILFTTSGGRHCVQITSLKARDHYVSPTVVTTRGEPFDIEFHSLTLNRGEDFVVSGIEFDGDVLALSGVTEMGMGQRLVTEAQGSLTYYTSGTRVTFAVAPTCLIGRYEANVRLTVKDTAGRRKEHTYCIPAYIDVTRGVTIKPSGVSLGWLSREDASTMFPISRDIHVSGPPGLRIANLLVMPQDAPISVSLMGETGTSAVVRIVIDRRAAAVPILEAQLRFSVTAGSGETYSASVPIAGAFR